MKLSRDFGFHVLFPTTSMSHRMNLLNGTVCALSHIRIYRAPASAVRSPKESEESVLDV